MDGVDIRQPDVAVLPEGLAVHLQLRLSIVRRRAGKDGEREFLGLSPKVFACFLVFPSGEAGKL